MARVVDSASNVVLQKAVFGQFGVFRTAADRAFRPSGPMSCLRGSKPHGLDPWVHVLFSLSISLAHGHTAVIFGSNN